MGTIEVINLPKWAKEYPYWVATAFDGHMWFYNAYKTKESAQEATSIIRDGFVIRNEEYKSIGISPMQKKNIEFNIRPVVYRKE